MLCPFYSWGNWNIATMRRWYLKNPVSPSHTYPPACVTPLWHHPNKFRLLVEMSTKRYMVYSICKRFIYECICLYKLCLSCNLEITYELMLWTGPRAYLNCTILFKMLSLFIWNWEGMRCSTEEYFHIIEIYLFKHNASYKCKCSWT